MTISTKCSCGAEFSGESGRDGWGELRLQESFRAWLFNHNVCTPHLDHESEPVGDGGAE